MADYDYDHDGQQQDGVAQTPVRPPTEQEVDAEVQADIRKAQDALPPLDASAGQAILSRIAGPPYFPGSGPGSAERQAFDAQVDADMRNVQRAPVPPPPYQPPLPNGMRHIDAYPAMNYVSPGHAPTLSIQGLRDFINGMTIPDYGPHITFVNDDPRNPSPDRPVTDATASMVEHAVVDSGAKSVNINSTTGGDHTRIDPLTGRRVKNTNSRHYQARAVDIDMVNGTGVSSSNLASRTLQDAFARQPNIRENIGPAYQTKRLVGRPPSPLLNVREEHARHDHFSGQD